MNLEVTSQEHGTLTLALAGWAERCKAEAKIMQEFAADESLGEESRAKAARNAEASREFQREAEELRAKLIAGRAPVLRQTRGPDGESRLVKVESGE